MSALWCHQEPWILPASCYTVIRCNLYTHVFMMAAKCQQSCACSKRRKVKNSKNEWHMPGRCLPPFEGLFWKLSSSTLQQLLISNWSEPTKLQGKLGNVVLLSVYLFLSLSLSPLCFPSFLCSYSPYHPNNFGSIICKIKMKNQYLEAWLRMTKSPRSSWREQSISHISLLADVSVGNEEDLLANISLVMRFMVLSGDEFFSKIWFPLLSYFFLFMLT